MFRPLTKPPTLLPISSAQANHYHSPRLDDPYFERAANIGGGSVLGFGSGACLGKTMDEQLSEYLEDLYRRGHEHDAEKADRLQRLRNVEPDAAQLLAVLVRALGAKRLLELGTSNGYSTLWLADAARSIDGSVLSVDVDPRVLHRRCSTSPRAASGLRRVANGGCRPNAQPRRRRVSGHDLPRCRTSRLLRLLAASLRVLRSGGLLVVDNVLSHADEMQTFRKLVQDEDRVTEAVVPTGAGALLIVRDPR